MEVVSGRTGKTKTISISRDLEDHVRFYSKEFMQALFHTTRFCVGNEDMLNDYVKVNRSFCQEDTIRHKTKQFYIARMERALNASVLPFLHSDQCLNAKAQILKQFFSPLSWLVSIQKKQPVNVAKSLEILMRANPKEDLTLLKTFFYALLEPYLVDPNEFNPRATFIRMRNLYNMRYIDTNKLTALLQDVLEKAKAFAR
ncbi:MAG: hypothetical protein WC838_07890, partial [Candidatus Margulisiibacteriota bacterium]|jgi:hypothetical protein